MNRPARDRAQADARRDRVLARHGYRVLRLPASLVLKHPLEAVARVRAALAKQEAEILKSDPSLDPDPEITRGRQWRPR